MKQRICFYVFGFPPDFSGATTQAIRIAKIFKKFELTCSFVSYTYNSKKVGVGNYEGFAVFRFFRPRNSIYLYHANMLRSMFIYKNHYDIIYLNGNDGQFWTAFYLIIFAKMFRKKIFMEINMEYEDPLSIRGTFFSKGKEFVASYINGYICLSSVILESMRRKYPKLSSTLIFNGVDTNLFRPIRDEREKLYLKNKLGIKTDERIIVSCGAICKRKGIDFLLDMWELVACQMPKTKLLLLGPMFGTDDENDDFPTIMRNRASKGACSGTVIFCGSVDNVNEYFQIADGFVFAGRQEGSPNVIREAMSCELPVIALHSIGITDDMIVDGFNGILVSVEDQKKMREYQQYDVPGDNVRSNFACSVMKILSDKNFATSLGRAARKDAVEKFSIEIQARNLLELLRSS